MDDVPAFHPYGRSARLFDLTYGFGDVQLSDQGELELRPELKHDIYLRIGCAVLSMSRIAMPYSPDDTTGVKNAYVLRNVQEPEASLLIDDGLVASSDSYSGTGTYTYYDGPSFYIGRTTTPQLDLPHSVGDRHLQLRLGALARNVYLRSTRGINCAVVAIHPEDEALVVNPHKRFVPGRSGMLPQVQVNEAWLHSMDREYP